MCESVKRLHTLVVFFIAHIEVIFFVHLAIKHLVVIVAHSSNFLFFANLYKNYEINKPFEIKNGN